VRSRILAFLIAAIAAAGASAYYFRAKPIPPPGPAPIASGRLEPILPITQIAPNLYVVPGGGCNTTVFVTSHGVVLVDTKYKDGWDGLLAQVRTVTDKPITYVMNTHRHPDHSQGNTQLPAGVKVIVHKNNVQFFKESRSVSGVGTGSWVGSDPVEMNDRFTLFDGDEAIDLYYFGPAHTSGDVFVVFRAARVMDVGDVMAGMKLPVIVLEAGGSGQTFAGVVDQALAIPNIDRIVTGHGAVLPHAELARYAKLNHVIVDYVRSSLRPGSVKNDVFKAFTPSDEFRGYDFSRRVLTMDEVDRSIRPKWKRVWPFTR
jgi:glyoxylase-like metal-dependent hydrolase (beta-lactamase superfamily II)